MVVDGIEYHLGQLMRFEQAPKFQQRGGVGRGFDGEINANETADRLAVLDRVFRAFVGQAKALLHHVYAQHACQADGRARPSPLR